MPKRKRVKKVVPFRRMKHCPNCKTERIFRAREGGRYYSCSGCGRILKPYDFLKD